MRKGLKVFQSLATNDKIHSDFSQGVSWKELAFFDGFCLVALSYFGGGELAFVSYFTWLARLASLFGRY